MSINTESILSEQKQLVRDILFYYRDERLLSVNLVKRRELKKLMTKALKFKCCIDLLKLDKSFDVCYRNHQNGEKCYVKMEWIESLIITILMYKFHH